MSVANDSSSVKRDERHQSHCLITLNLPSRGSALMVIPKTFRDGASAVFSYVQSQRRVVPVTGIEYKTALTIPLLCYETFTLS